MGEVLRRNADIWKDRRYRRLWPVYIEAILSIAWAYCLIVLTAFWLISYSLGYQPLGASPIPNWWGMLVATFCLIQLFVGVILDRRYDPSIGPFYFWSVLYPLGYWFLMSIITVISTPQGILRTARGPARWRTAQNAAHP